jgi:prepilin-type N-terminal cleavage/methylation domain-containing protein
MRRTQHSKCCSNGFTLVEVLIVLVIAGLGITLVAPSLINAYEEVKAAAEEQKMTDILDAVKMRSFFRQLSYSVVLAGNVLKIKDTDTSIDFQHITFPEQRITFNANGFADVGEVRYTKDGHEKTLSFEVKTAAD